MVEKLENYNNYCLLLVVVIILTGIHLCIIQCISGLRN